MSETRSEGTQPDNWLLTSFKHHTLSSQIIQYVENRNTMGNRCVHCCFVYDAHLWNIYIAFTAKIEAASSKKEVKGVEESFAEEVTVASYLRINI